MFKQNGTARPAPFDRRSRIYRFKLWAYANPNAKPERVRHFALGLGLQSWAASYNEVRQTRQVLRDLGVTLPGEPARRLGQ